MASHAVGTGAAERRKKGRRKGKNRENGVISGEKFRENFFIFPFAEGREGEAGADSGKVSGIVRGVRQRFGASE